MSILFQGAFTFLREHFWKREDLNRIFHLFFCKGYFRGIGKRFFNFSGGRSSYQCYRR